MLLAKTKDAGVTGEPGSFWPLMAVGATWITYFAALYLNFCDFSRYAKDKAAVSKGNLWGLPINLLLFSLVAGVTTIAAYKVYGEVLLHPDQISAKFDSWFLALLAALTFAVATLGINVVANFVSPAFDFSNVFPQQIDFKKGGYIAALIALVLYPFAPWEGNAAGFVGAIGATMGPLFGIIMVDYYLIAKGEINVQALYQEDGEYRYQGGWHVSAFIAAGDRRALLEHPAELHHRAAAWWGVYGWFFGVAIGGGAHHLLSALRPRGRWCRRAPEAATAQGRRLDEHAPRPAWSVRSPAFGSTRRATGSPSSAAAIRSTCGTTRRSCAGPGSRPRPAAAQARPDARLRALRPPRAARRRRPRHAHRARAAWRRMPRPSMIAPRRAYGT